MAKDFSVTIWIRYVAPTGTMRAAGGKNMHIANATITTSHMSRKRGKFTMHKMKLFVMVPLIPLSNLASKAYTYGIVNIRGRSGSKDTTGYQSGR